MAFVRTKQIPPGNGNYYRYLVENRRENGHVRQKVLAYLGTASGQADTGYSDGEIPEQYRDRVGGAEVKTTKDGYVEKPLGTYKVIEKHENYIIKETYDSDYIEPSSHLIMSDEEIEDDLVRRYKKGEIDGWTKAPNSYETLRGIYYISFDGSGKKIGRKENVKIKQKRNNSIIYRKNGQDYLVNRKYNKKIYSYSDGDYVFINDKKKAVDEID